MKTLFKVCNWRSPGQLLARFVMLGLLSLAVAAGVRQSFAGLAEPDAFFYGSIMISNRVVTVSDTEIVVEARRAPAGPAIAVYRMGDNLAYGDLYAIRVSVEAAAPLNDTNALTTGSTMYLVLSNSSGELTTRSVVVAERGAIVRLNLEFANAPDTNALLASWKAVYGLTDLSLDSDQDGSSDADEYIAGTHPLNNSSAFQLSICASNQQPSIEFHARRADGPGYEQMNRFYSLECSTNFSGDWLGIPGYSNVMGSDQTIAYPIPTDVSGRFYRGRIWLQPQ